VPAAPSIITVSAVVVWRLVSPGTLPSEIEGVTGPNPVA
jgi:hypothetical protein